MKWLTDDNDKIRLLFGFCLLLLIALLAAGLIIEHVNEQTSFGLGQIITILSVLSGAFGQWAFRHYTDNQDKKP